MDNKVEIDRIVAIIVESGKLQEFVSHMNQYENFKWREPMRVPTTQRNG